MIRQKELRRDNWLRDYYGIQRQVAYVGETIGLHNDIGGTDKYQHNPIFSNDLKDLHPIPITPEILAKCGFKDEADIGDFELEYKKFIFTYLKDGLQISVVVNGDTCQYIIIKQPKYLHHLQNLFYSLTGEELNYKP